MAATLLHGPQTAADVHVDVRSDGVLLAGLSEVPYVVAVEDCSRLTSITLGAGAATETHALSETTRSGARGCELHVRRAGGDKLDPAGGYVEIEERCPSASASFGDGTCLRT
jgi:hypothetical protein